MIQLKISSSNIRIFVQYYLIVKSYFELLVVAFICNVWIHLKNIIIDLYYFKTQKNYGSILLYNFHFMRLFKINVILYEYLEVPSSKNLCKNVYVLLTQ